MSIDSQRVMLAFLYMSVNAVHLALFNGLNGSSYYVVAALFDLLLITFASNIHIHQTVAIQKLCIISIAANFAGWLMWLLYLDPFAYNAVFVAIYIYALIILTGRDDENVGDDAECGNDIIFFSNSNSSIKNMLKHKRSM